MKSPLKTNPRHGQAIKITRRSHGPTDRDRSHLHARIIQRNLKWVGYGTGAASTRYDLFYKYLKNILYLPPAVPI